METDHDSFKRQLSTGGQMAVSQAPRPMPNIQGESFQHGSSVMDYAKNKFRALGPPDEERKGNYLEQLQPIHNALSVFAWAGNIQTTQAGSLGFGPFGTSQVSLGQPSGNRLMEPMFQTPGGQAVPPGQFGAPTGAAPAARPA